MFQKSMVRFQLLSILVELAVQRLLKVGENREAVSCDYRPSVSASFTQAIDVKIGNLNCR